MGGAAEYVKADPVGLGHAIGDLVDGIRGDGMSQTDFQAAVNVVMKSASAVNEAKAVPEAAAEHVVSGITERLGDKALARAIEAEALEPPPE